MGRNTRYSEEIAEEICSRLANGESLNAICKDEHLPHESTVRSWSIDPEHPISTNYARARQIAYLRMGEDIIDIADRGSEDVQRDRLRVEARKWVLSKMLPKVFGDKLSTESTHTLRFSDEFEAFIRSINIDKDAKVIDGSLAEAGGGVGGASPPVRSGSAERNT